MKLRITFLGAWAILAIASLINFSGASVPEAKAASKTSWSLVSQNSLDSDGDGLSNWKEINLYHTNPYAQDSNGNDISDFQELMSLPKHIYISLKDQELRYYAGPYLMDDFLVSTGVPGMDTPTGEFSVLRKVPTVLYQGPGYYLPNTKWNLMFKPSYYVHGAYWHSNFGNKMSHGCVNVSYTDVKPLYDWAEVGTPITILAGDFPANLSMDLPNNTLVRDGQTIYIIQNGKKYGFADMGAFAGLGYDFAKVSKSSTSGIPEGSVLNNSNIAHLSGSWLISDKTVYYAAESGLIPVSAWGIFQSNADASTYLLKANASDLAKPILPLMSYSDSRVAL